MKSKQTMEIELTEDEVGNIIRKYLGEQQGFDFLKAEIIFDFKSEVIMGDDFTKFVGLTARVKK